MALNINGYDDGMADNNNHVGNRSEYVTNNNKEFKGLDKDKGDNSLVLAGRDLSGVLGATDAKHAFNVIGAKKVNEFSKEDIEKFGVPVALGNGEVGYVLEELNINGKLVPVVNGKMKSEQGKWIPAPGGNVSLEEYKKQQSKPDLDDMTVVRKHPDDKEKEAKVLGNFTPAPASKSPDYPSGSSSAKCALGENGCSSESLPNSNEGARESYEISGHPQVTYEELEAKKNEEEGSYFPGMLPGNRIPEATQ